MIRSVAALVIAALLGACGTEQPHRTTGGVASGAATGAAIGLLGGPIGVAVGAMIGGGAGGLAGASTDSSQVNLPAPPWSDSN